MTLFRFSLLVLALQACAAPAAHAADTVYKCTADGKTTYADRPCERGASRMLPPPVGVDPNVDAVRGADSRTLLETEKLRAELGKTAQAQQQQQQQRDKRREEARADRDNARLARAAAVRRKRCDRLRLQVKWAEQDLARAGLRKQEAARTRLQRRRELMAVECRA